MARSAVLSNGRLAVCLDEHGFVNDFYYPYVGMDNMTSARFVHHKIGIWVDGQFSWLDSDSWHTDARLDDHTMMARCTFTSKKLGISINFRDFVDSRYDFFGRVAIVENHLDHHREVRLFFSQVFQISDAGRVDTAIYTPARNPYILTYHGNMSFVAGLRTQDGSSFDQYAVGNYGIEGKAGTYLDAEDGELSGNSVEHGGVDSVIRTSFSIHPKGSYHVDYWVCASEKGYSHASKQHRVLARSGLYHYLNETSLHWKRWLAQSSAMVDAFDVKFQGLARKSLLVIKAHMDSRGGVIASLDSSIYNYGRDYYSYVWPRDGYYALLPLLRMGYTEEVKNFLSFILPRVHPRGYVHHKYLSDGSPGSTWHPLVQNGKAELNIQEDETASVVLLALEYLHASKDPSCSFSKKLIEQIIVPCSNFMSTFIEPSTGLVHPSYNLWEEIFVSSTYTNAIVYRALLQASEFVEGNGIDADTSSWRKTSDSIKSNIGMLFVEDKQWFASGLLGDSPAKTKFEVLDTSSLFGLYKYGLLDKDDTALYATAVALEANNKAGGGYVRYKGDPYMRNNREGVANPWYVCTSWMAQWHNARQEYEKRDELLQWMITSTPENGILSEQVDYADHSIRGVSPLVWSHAEVLSLLLDISK